MKTNLYNELKITLLILMCITFQKISQSQTDPCLSQSSMACGNDYNYSLASTSGIWNPPGPWGTPGSEAVFTYTAPITGPYNILVTNNNYYVDLFVQEGSCGQNGWTYVNDIFKSELNTLNLLEGITYYFLIDDENTTASSGVINISCPCIPPLGGFDNSLSITANTANINSSTINACNDCNFRSSPDEVIEFEITCAGDYSFTLCGGANWDTYIYLSDQPCGGNVIAFNDDDCGLQSTITSNLEIGLYYLAIEGWSASSQGNYSLNISTTCLFSPLPVELVYFEGENINSKNKLKWLTASETNNDYFKLERSVDGNVFKQIGIVEGNGTTNESVLYTFTDETFSLGTNYYRLTQVDYDGMYEVYDVIRINSDSDKGLSIFPNPTNGLINIRSNVKSKNSNIILQNELGKNIFEKEFQSINEVILEINEDPGIYFVLLETENRVFMEKIIVQ